MTLYALLMLQLLATLCNSNLGIPHSFAAVYDQSTLCFRDGQMLIMLLVICD